MEATKIKNHRWPAVAAARGVARLAVLGCVAFGALPALAEGEEARATCVACHNEDGNSIVPMFPKLAGLRAEYMEKQLKEFISGKRKNEVMAPILPMIKPADVPALAAYYAAQKPAPGTVQDASLLPAGKKVYMDGNEDTGVPSCAGCHQPQAQGDERYPRLAGQHQEYLLTQMKNFAAGERTNDAGRVMRAVAKRMTEQEMKAVAEYIAGQ